MIVKPTVFISYNWGSEDIATTIENRLEPIADVRRDKSSVKHWQSLTEFMKTIRNNDLVVLIISDAYLKSVACLYEVMQLIKDENWVNHSMFVVENDATGIYRPIDQLAYVKYWNEEYNKLETALKEFDHAYTTAQAEELKKIESINLHISEFMKVVADRYNPKIDLAIVAIEKHVKSGYEKLNLEIESGRDADSDNCQDCLTQHQPIFDIKILAVDKQIPGTAEVYNPWNISTYPKHKNLQLSFELVSDVVVRNATLFGKHIDTVIEPHKKYYLTIAFGDSPDAKRWSKHITTIKHGEYKEQDGYPVEFIIEYEDEYGEELYQAFELCSKDEIRYYRLRKGIA